MTLPATALAAAAALGWGEPVVAPAALPSAPAFAALGDDAAANLIILGETRPIFLRLRVMIGDRSFRAAGADATRAALARLDADGDGKVTIAEAEATGLNLLVGPVAAGTPPAGPGALDTSPKDGIIAADEVLAALGGSGDALQVTADTLAERRTDALFDHLDRDQDGAITRPELATAVGTLRQLDRDADEWVGLAEIAGAAASLPAPGMRARTTRVADVPWVLTLAAGESPLRVIRALMKKYDTGSSRGAGRPDARLSLDECALQPEVFAAIDTTGDGLLASDELRKWLATAPSDAVLDVLLDPDPAQPARALVRTAEGDLPAGFHVRQLAADLVEVEVGPIRLDLQVTPVAPALAATRQTLRARFEAADTTKDGYLERAELTQDDGQPSPFASLFAACDHDHDGKLTPAELDEAVARQAADTQGRLTLTAANEGRSVFGLLDLDSNRQLGAREVQDTFTRVSGCDRDRDGRITPEEVPHHIHLTLTQGNLAPLLANPAANLAGASSAAMVPSSTRPTAGPPWFRKMDRNHDGDVSRREFLGTHAQFDRLDRDRDGLLAPSEAEAATTTAAPVKGPGG